MGAGEGTSHLGKEAEKSTDVRPAQASDDQLWA